MPTDLWAHQTSRIALSRAKATGGSPLNSKPCIPLSIHHRCVDAKRHLNLKTSKLVSIFYSKLAPPTGLHHLCGCSFLNLGAILDCSFSPASYPTQMQVLLELPLQLHPCSKPHHLWFGLLPPNYSTSIYPSPLQSILK